MNREKIKVSVIIPCRNEINNIEECLNRIIDFEAPEGGFEVIVIDGMSDDGTREVLEELSRTYDNLTILDNPERTVPHAMNMGIMKARGEYIVRCDVRCIHPRTYLTDLIHLSEETKADNVGGVLVPEGRTYVQKSIAAAYGSPIAMGGALRDRGDFIGETDAVYGGCFRRDRLIEVGMYDESMVRNQDDELSFRMRKLGGKIVQSGRIKIKYFPRSRFSQLFKQFFQYGYWKVEVLKRHPKQLSWRHFAPSALVLGFVILAILSLLNRLFGYAMTVYAGSYIAVLLMESLRLSMKKGFKLLPGIAISILIMHMGFGSGFIMAIISGMMNVKPRVVETLSR
jgi:glycosyltransferase involved in cell wall biosynthesis